MPTDRINIREIAALAGVSTASVSRALRGPSPYLKEEKRQAILKLCAEHRYYPNVHTQRLFAHRSRTVALFYPPFESINTDYQRHIPDAIFGSCMMGAQNILTPEGIDLLLCEVTPGFLAAERHLKMCRGKNVDGILVWGACDQDAYVREIAAEKLPLVMVQNELPECAAPVVVADDYAGMLAVTRRALTAGHRRIAVASAAAVASTGRARMNGICDALREAGVEPGYVTRNHGYGYRFGQEAAREIQQHAPETTCIIAPNDMAAWGCIDTLRTLGRRTPDDISVLGGDGIPVPGELELASFYTPAYEMGRLGAELLLNMAESKSGRTAAMRTVLPVRVIEGNTLRQCP